MLNSRGERKHVPTRTNGRSPSLCATPCLQLLVVVLGMPCVGCTRTMTRPRLFSSVTKEWVHMSAQYIQRSKSDVRFHQGGVADLLLRC